MNQRQERIFDEVVADPEREWGLKDFRALLPDVSRVTLYRDLDAMVEQQLLQPKGVTAQRVYRLNPKSDAYLVWDLSRRPDLRKPVGYNPALLKRYVPNGSFLLSHEQRRALAAINAPDRSKVTDEQYRRVLNTLIIDLAHASSNLEDVNISWLDTKTLLELGERPEGLSEQQLKLVLNHKDATRFLVENKLEIATRDLRELHALLMANLLPNPMTIGAFREAEIYFPESAYRPLNVPSQLREEIELFCNKANAISDPFEQSVFVMLFIPYLQVFHDGNKRASRIAMNIPLLNAKLAPFSFANMKKRDYALGLLAFYERGRHHLLTQAFVSAYVTGAKRYEDTLKHVASGGILASVTADSVDTELTPVPRPTLPGPRT